MLEWILTQCAWLQAELLFSTTLLLWSVAWDARARGKRPDCMD